MLAITTIILGQETSKPRAKLVKRFERGCGTDCTRELAIDIGGIQVKLEDLVTIRICSGKPFPLAISIATAPPEPLIQTLEGVYRVTADRILFLRSEDCLARRSNVSATEYWIIPKGAPLPPHLEAFTSGQLKTDDFGAKSSIGDPISYKSGLDKLPQALKESPDSFGIILGYYYNKPSPELKNRLNKATRLLREGGVPGDRYFSILTPWPGERAPSYLEPKYPILLSISIRKDE